LLWPVGDQDGGRATIEGCIDNLKTSRTERSTVLALTGDAARALQRADTAASIRVAAAAVGRAHVDGVLEVTGADDARRQQVHDAVEGAPLSIGELAIKGRDLIAQDVVSAGPQLGRALAALLEAALEDPTLNTREGLLERARADIG
nr:hypothetical protein [Deltaproteobacteria bacterium]